MSQTSRRPPGSSSTLQSGISVTVSNEFELLSEEEEHNDTMPTLTPILATTRTAPKTKKVRVPPITIVNQSSKQLRELMSNNNIAQTDYNMRMTRTGVQLLCMSEESFHISLDTLKKLNIEFHTYTLPSEQPVRVVLSGLPVYDIAELEEELATLGVVCAEVKLLSRKVTGAEESALYVLNFVKGSTKLSELQKVRAVFNTTVKWRYFERRPTDAVQCHRCQRFGHGMRNCNLPPLCVKCGEKHHSAECKLPKKADLERVDKSETRGLIKCANCSGQHTANYRGCPSRKVYIEKLAKLRTERRHPAPPPLLFRTTEGRPTSSTAPPPRGSYAQVLRTQTTVNQDLFSMSEFLSLAREMFERLASCQSKQQQILALFELTTKYIYNV